MFTATHIAALQSSSSSEATPRLTATNSIRKPQHHGLAARWLMVEGKLQCQWD